MSGSRVYRNTFWQRVIHIRNSQWLFLIRILVYTFPAGARACTHRTRADLTTFKKLSNLARPCAIAASLIFCTHLQATSVGDSLLQRIETCADQGAVADDLSAAFQANPRGEFLLAPANRDLKFGILIYNIDILPEKALFSAAIAFRENKSNQLIAFRADDIVFSKTNGLTGPVLLYLLENVKFHLGKAAEITLAGGKTAGNFALMECRGLREFGIAGTAAFNPEMILPCNDSGTVIPGKLETSFSTRAAHWNDMAASISVKPFQIRGLSNFIFRISSATLDLSESFNSGEIIFPPEYFNESHLGNNPEIWEGFYLKSGSVTLPPHFKNGNGQRISAGVVNLFIDEFGLSGKLFAKNLLDYSNGNLAGWQFSIDEIALEMVFNHIKSGTLNGDLGLPVLPDSSRLTYLAEIASDDYYSFTVGVKNNLHIPALRMAEINLDNNSYVLASIKSGKIELIANLSGVCQLISKKPEENFEMPDITFTHFQIKNEAPRLAIEYFGLKNHSRAQHLLKYPVQINEIGLRVLNDKCILNADLSINLTEYISGSASFAVNGILINKNGKDRLIFTRFDLNEVTASFEKAGTKISARISKFTDNPDYGTGFNGQAVFEISQLKTGGHAKILFGNKSGLRYWYFDAGLTWPAPGVPVVPGLNINGFTGGAWHRMRPKYPAEIIQNANLGSSETGINYVPDTAAGLGLKAGMYLNGGSDAGYTAKVILEIQTNRYFGINHMLLYGDLQVMETENFSDQKQLKNSFVTLPANSSVWDQYQHNFQPKGKISGPFMLQFDFKNQAFSANASIYIFNMLNHSVQGSGTNGKAGELSAFFSKSDWFIRAGIPAQPLSAKIQIGMATGISCGMYLNTGTKLLPAASAPPEIIQALRYNPRMDAARDLQALSDGYGFAMGLRFDANAGAAATDKKFSLYANLKAIAASDIMIFKYPKNTICKSTGSAPGINGWYANGSIYTYIQGKLGAKAGKISVDVLTLTGAMAMQGEGPNPVHAQGDIFVSFNLGGFLKFSNFVHVEMGNSCEPGNYLTTDSSVIRSISPSDGKNSVDPLSTMQVNFSVPVNTAFQTPEGKTYIFRCQAPMVHQSIKQLPYTWNADVSNQAFSSTGMDPLPQNAAVKITVQVSLNEIRGGSEFPVILSGAPVQEVKSAAFTTSNYPDNIPLSNIQQAWPGILTVNYYAAESNISFIKLHVRQNYLFNISGTKTIIRFQDQKSNIPEETIATYDASSATLSFASPQKLSPGKAYKIQIYRVSAAVLIGIQNPVVTGILFPAGVSAGTAASTYLKPVKLCEYWFRNSEYRSLKDKISEMKLTGFKRISYSDGNSDIAADFINQKSEYFDESEIGKSWRSGDHLYYVSDPSTTWIKTELLNKVYKKTGNFIPANYISRDTTETGLPPFHALHIREPDLASEKLDLGKLAGGNAFLFADNHFQIEYKLVKTASTDLEEIKTRVIAALLNGSINSGDITHWTGFFKGSTPTGPGKMPSGSLPSAPVMPIISSPTATPGSSIISPATSTLVNSVQSLTLAPFYIPGSYLITMGFRVPGTQNPRNVSSFTINLK